MELIDEECIYTIRLRISDFTSAQWAFDRQVFRLRVVNNDGLYEDDKAWHILTIGAGLFGERCVTIIEIVEIRVPLL